MTDPKDDKTDDENEDSVVAVEATEDDAEEDSAATPVKVESKEADDVDEDDAESKSTAPPVDESSLATPKTNGSPASTADPKSKRNMPPGSRRGRAPAVKGLTIPFRTVKKVSN